MENNNGIDLEQIRNSNREFRLLDDEHNRLEQELEELLRRRVLTPGEEIEKRRLQKKKLAGKDRMTEILRDYSGESSKAFFDPIPRKRR